MKRKYGEGSCTQRGDGWWETAYYDNEGRRRKNSFTSESKARKFLARQLALKEAGKLDAYEGRTKIDQLADVYLTYIKNSKPKSYNWVELVWRVHLEPFFGGYLASRVTTEHLNRYIVERKATAKNELARNGTVNRELQVLKAMFHYGAEKMSPPLTTRIPIFPAKLRESDPRSGWLTEAQYDKLQECCELKWLRGLLALACSFGFRKGELLGLKVGQVNFEDRRIELPPGTTKNDRGRRVVMTVEVMRYLKPCTAGKKSDDALFTWDDGSPVRDFRKAWKKLCKAAGVHILPHDFRRTAIRGMVRSGISERTAMLISGHQTRSVFDRYNVDSDEDLVDAAIKLEARNSENGRKMAVEVEIDEDIEDAVRK